MAFTFDEEQLDCLQELINIAMGQASDQLARYLDTFVFLQVPSISFVSPEELSNSLISGEKLTAVVSQGFFGQEGVRGEALLLYKNEDSKRLADLLGYEPGELSEEEQFIDMSAILTTTFLNVFSSEIENKMSYNAPKLLSKGDRSVVSYLDSLTFTWDIALKVNISYQVTDYSFNCEMILLIPERAITSIRTVIARLLEEL
jgi:chemotaxis protein CheC